MLGLPTTWLIGGVVACAILLAGTVHIRHQAKVEGARNEGIAIGKGEAATTTLAEAKKAADDFRGAEAETPVDADRGYFKRLCARSASCALRDKYKGGAK